MKMVGGSSKRSDAVTNRARLLTVAQAVFAESGFDLEVNDIASRAQLGIGTLYRHFGNREDLLRAIVTQTVEDALEQTQQAIEPYKDDPQSAFQALITVELHVQQQYLPIFATLRDRRMKKLFDIAQRESIQAQLLSPVREVLQQCIQSGVFRKDLDLDLAIAMLIGALTGSFEVLGKHRSLDELKEQLFPFLWTMFTK